MQLTNTRDQHKFYFRKVKPFFEMNVSNYNCPLEAFQSYDVFEGDANYKNNRNQLLNMLDDYFYLQMFSLTYGYLPDLSGYPATDVTEKLVGLEFDNFSQGMHVNISAYGEDKFVVKCSIGTKEESFIISLEGETLVGGKNCPDAVSDMLDMVDMTDPEFGINADCDIMNNIWFKTWCVTDPSGVKFIKNYSNKLLSSDVKNEREFLTLSV